MKKLLVTLLTASIFSILPSCAQDAEGYDMSNFAPGSESAGLSEFRITPDMYPKHSYRRKELMQTYGPRGKSIGFSAVSGKAFDYLNPQTLKNRRNAPKASDPYLDSAYEAPAINSNFDPAYQSKKSFGSELKPLGSKHAMGDNPFSNKKNLYSGGASEPKPFLNAGSNQKFDTSNSNQLNDNSKVFDDESMF